MKPVAIFRHLPIEGPGYLGEFLNRHGIPSVLIAIDQNDPIPADPAPFSGLAFMGGPMSVNDDLPWIPHTLALIRAAVAADIPLLGHCLGGQLMAKALGGVVSRNPVKEIGWGEVSVLDNPAAQCWFGDIHHFNAFHWHGETFSIPSQATRILESAYCPNQAYTFGPHLGLQCHVEMTTEMIADWCKAGAREITRASNSPAVQSVAHIAAQSEINLPPMQCVADRLYTHWIKGLKP